MSGIIIYSTIEILYAYLILPIKKTDRGNRIQSLAFRFRFIWQEDGTCNFNSSLH